MGVVVYGVERLRDGIEEWARVFSSEEEALEYLNKQAEHRFAFDNCEFKVFELGREITDRFDSKKTRVPQAPVVKTQFRLRK